MNGPTRLRAMCGNELEAGVMVEIAQLAGIADEDSRVGCFEGSWIVSTGWIDDPGLEGFKKIESKLSEKTHCWKAELAHEARKEKSGERVYCVIEFEEEGGVFEYEESWDDMNSPLAMSGRADWWNTQEGEVTKWYTFEEFNSTFD